MTRFDPTTLEIYRALYTSVAEEMGVALRRTSFSPNIKERRDYSCAVFDSSGRVIAQGDHMPVHLGSMPMAVAGEICEDVMRLILANVRSSSERRADFEAQIGSLKTGATRLLEIVERRGAAEARAYAAHLISYSARVMRHAIAAIPDGIYEAED